MVLDSGLEILVERGPSTGLGLVTFADAIERSGVPRPSAYRAFGDSDDEPQKHFRRELLVDLIQSCQFVEASNLDIAFADVTSEAGRDDITADELTAQLREVVRLGSLRYWELTQSDRHFLVYMTAQTSCRDPNNELNSVFCDAERESGANYIRLYRRICDLFGLRLRQGWTWEMFGGAVTTIQTGSYVFRNFAAVPDPFKRGTGPNGEERDWTMMGVLIESLIIQCAEPNPRMVVSANPQDWLPA